MSQSPHAQCKEPNGYATFKIATACVVTGGCVFASLVNVLLIRCAVKLFKQTADAMHLFLASMTTADLLLTAFAIPGEAVASGIFRPKSTLFCGIMRSSSYLGFAASGLFLALVNMDKVLFFGWPQRYRLLSKKYAFLTSGAVFAASLTVVVCFWGFHVVHLEDPCAFSVSRDRKYLHAIFTVSTCMVPFLSSLVFSVVLFRLYLNRRNAASHPASMAFNSRVESLAFIFSSSLWTAISLLPNRAYLIWYLHAHQAGQCLPTWLQWTQWTCQLLYFSSPIGNCLITSLVYAPYRQELSSIVNRLRSRLGLRTSELREPESFEMS